MPEKNLYKREGIWWLRATVRGRQIRESLRTSDVRNARKIRDKRLQEIKASAYHGETIIKWEDAVTAWGKHTKGQLAPSTAKRYAVSLLQCHAHLERYSIDVIDGKIIMDLIQKRQADGAKPATIRRDLTAISQVLQYAEAMEWREGNPTLDKRKLLSERRDPIFLPLHHEIELVIAASDPAFGAMIRAAWLTGCRQNELVTAEWSGFSHNQRTLEIMGKGTKRRVIELSPAAANLIKAQPRQLKSNLIFCREGGLAFNEAASRFTHVRRTVAAQAKKDRRKFVGFRFHDLRHLFAVESLKGKLEIHMGIYDLSRHLGHTSVKTTEIYLEFLTPAEQKAAQSGLSQKTSQAAKLAAG